MLPPVKCESQKGKLKSGGVCVCTAEADTLLSWVLVLTLSLGELLKESLPQRSKLTVNIKPAYAGSETFLKTSWVRSVL